MPHPSSSAGRRRDRQPRRGQRDSRATTGRRPPWSTRPIAHSTGPRGRAGTASGWSRATPPPWSSAGPSRERSTFEQVQQFPRATERADPALARPLPAWRQSGRSLPRFAAPRARGRRAARPSSTPAPAPTGGARTSRWPACSRGARSTMSPDRLDDASSCSAEQVSTRGVPAVGRGGEEVQGAS